MNVAEADSKRGVEVHSGALVPGNRGAHLGSGVPKLAPGPPAHAGSHHPSLPEAPVPSLDPLSSLAFRPLTGSVPPLACTRLSEPPLLCGSLSWLHTGTSEILIRISLRADAAIAPEVGDSGQGQLGGPGGGAEGWQGVRPAPFTTLLGAPHGPTMLPRV